MQEYLDSLEKLKAYRLVQLAPGHGELMPEPLAVIDAIIAHRLQREAKIARVLAASGGGTLDELVLHAYDDVPASLHAMAKFSLWAHLIKLEREGRAAGGTGHWSAR
jgi:glyoxylase-like metal-dependent hydrolase (beta-lactamase superfamily II)